MEWRDHSTHGSWGKHGSGEHWISEESEEHPATQEPGQDEESSGTSYASASGCGSRVGGRVMVGSGTTRIDEDGRDCHHRHGSRYLAALQTRMLNLETMLQQVVNHLNPQK